MQNYKDAKKLLFQQPGLKHAIINIDDAFGAELAQTFSQQLNIITYATQQAADISVTKLDAHAHGFTICLNTPSGEHELQIPLLGQFNVSNVLAVIGVLQCLDVSWSAIQTEIENLQRVPGRMQSIANDNKPLVVIDYAHTPDALQHALTTLRTHCQGQLWCVFGCGGDRDRGKRAQMASVAERHSDRVIVTNDNPRTESPEQIFADIRTGFSMPDQAQIQPDRRQAIAWSIQQATANDVILIAGKGHEDYQIIGEQRLPFSDSQVASEQLQSLD